MSFDHSRVVLNPRARSRVEQKSRLRWKTGVQDDQTGKIMKIDNRYMKLLERLLIVLPLSRLQQVPCEHRLFDSRRHSSVLTTDSPSLHRYLDARRCIVSILRVVSKLDVKLTTSNPIRSDWRRMTNGPRSMFRGSQMSKSPGFIDCDRVTLL